MSRLAILCAEWSGPVSSVLQLNITLSLACNLVSLLNSQSNRHKAHLPKGAFLDISLKVKTLINTT